MYNKKKTCPNENETEKSEKSEIEILKKTKKKTITTTRKHAQQY